jgi:ssDNA-binding replication factor A large subunit
MYEIGVVTEIKVKRSFAERKGFDTVYLEGQVLDETDNAILFELLDGDSLWIPLLVIVE